MASGNISMGKYSAISWAKDEVNGQRKLIDEESWLTLDDSWLTNQVDWWINY